MKTQRLHLLEAMNFALAGHDVNSYEGGFTLKLKKGYLSLYHDLFKRGIAFTSSDMKNLKDHQWHAGDNRSIKGYYNE